MPAVFHVDPCPARPSFHPHSTSYWCYATSKSMSLARQYSLLQIIRRLAFSVMIFINLVQVVRTSVARLRVRTQLDPLFRARASALSLQSRPTSKVSDVHSSPFPKTISSDSKNPQ